MVRIENPRWTGQHRGHCARCSIVTLICLLSLSVLLSGTMSLSAIDADADTDLNAGSAATRAESYDVGLVTEGGAPPEMTIQTDQSVPMSGPVRNYGTQTATDVSVQWTVRVRSSGDILHEASESIATLAPDAEEVVEFDPWMAPSSPTELTFTVETIFASDTNPSNDAVTFNVSVVDDFDDVGIKDFQTAPTDIVSQTTLSIFVNVTNSGTTVLTSVPVRLTIVWEGNGTQILSTVYPIDSIAPAETERVVFDDVWTVPAQDDYLITIEIDYQDDNAANNVEIISLAIGDDTPLNIGITDVISNPEGPYVSGVEVEFRAFVQNFGSTPSGSIEVRCTIHSPGDTEVYRETVTLEPLASMESMFAVFPSWTTPATEDGEYAISIGLVGLQDQEPADNWHNATVQVGDRYDAGVLSVSTTPRSPVEPGTALTISALIANHGNVAIASGALSCEASSPSGATSEIGEANFTDLSPYGTANIEVVQWSAPSTLGNWTLTVLLELTGDENSSNDEAGAVIEVEDQVVQRIDAGVVTISHPTNGAVYERGAIAVNATVQNYGTDTASYTASLEVVALAAAVNSYSSGFETSPSDWTTTGDGDGDGAGVEWTHVTATESVDDAASHGGSRYWEASGSTQSEASSATLTSPALDLDGAYLAELSFYHRSTLNEGDRGLVMARSAAGDEWQTIAVITGAEGNWTPRSVTLDTQMGSDIELGFRLVVNGNATLSSWAIDDIAVHTVAGAVVHDASRSLTAQQPGAMTALAWSHQIDIDGSYLVIVHTDLAGDQYTVNDRERRQFTISTPTVDAPIASIDEPLDGAAVDTDEPITFDGSASTDPEGLALSYRWVSSIDGELSRAARFTTTLAEGNHTITLNVTNSGGRSATASVIVLVTRTYRTTTTEGGVTVTMKYGGDGDLSIEPSAPLPATPAPPANRTAVGTAVEITTTRTAIEWASVTIPLDTDALPAGMNAVSLTLYSLDTGASQWELVPSAVFDPTEEHFVMNLTHFTLFAPFGLVIENAPPRAMVTGPVKVMVGDALSFDASGSTDPDDRIAYYEWDFDGDGTVDYKSSASALAPYTFDEPGTYTVEVTVFDSNGASSSKSYEIKVEAQPEERSPLTWILVLIGLAGVVIAILLLRAARTKKAYEVEGEEMEGWGYDDDELEELRQKVTTAPKEAARPKHAKRAHGADEEFELQDVDMDMDMAMGAGTAEREDRVAPIPEPPQRKMPPPPSEVGEMQFEVDEAGTATVDELSLDALEFSTDDLDTLKHRSTDEFEID